MKAILLRLHLTVAIAASILSAQNISSGLSGVVTDSTDAAMPGVAVLAPR